MSALRLSKRLQQIYSFLINYSEEHGYAPTVREIGDAVGLKSPSTVHMHLQTLEDMGLIRRLANKSRTIEIVSEDDSQRDKIKTPVQNVVNVLQNVGENTIALPLVGRVAAGTPILAEQNVEDIIPLPTSIVGDTSSFILKVQGESMINAGIFSGDYLVVRETPTADNGDIVVALIDDSATVKTFYKEKDFIRLQPENDTMDPIFVKNPTILGKVQALLRHL